MPIRRNRVSRMSPSVTFSRTSVKLLPKRNDDGPRLTRKKTSYARPAYLDHSMQTRKIGLVRTRLADGARTSRQPSLPSEQKQRPIKVSNVTYRSAGHEACYFSRKQREMLGADGAASQTDVRYVDCTAGAATATHAVCNIHPKPRAAPYLARCEGDDCHIVSYGARDAASLQQLATETEQKLTKQ
jgi:hypothetical protein